MPTVKSKRKPTTSPSTTLAVPCRVWGAAGRAGEGSLARFDPMQAYMREVQQHPLLTPDEEKALAVRYAETGDREAAARLVTANLRLVVKIAYEYRRAYRNMMDLVQEGNMGLMQAVKKYDPYRGVKLSSYAAWWIRAYMLRYILANWRMVKLGTTQAQRKLFFNLSKEKARLSAMASSRRTPKSRRRLDVTEVEVEEMDKRMSKGDASLDLPVSENDGRQIARVELLPATDTTPDLATESAELGVLLRKHLAEFRATLADKDLIIFDQRLVADEPRTLQDLGEEFGVSRERVRQLEARITGRLRTFLGHHLGDAVEIARLKSAIAERRAALPVHEGGRRLAWFSVSWAKLIGSASSAIPSPAPSGSTTSSPKAASESSTAPIISISGHWWRSSA